MSKPKLTDKQKQFIKHYITNGFNATQACISAGYSKKTAMQMGSENLLKPYIQKEISKYFEGDEYVIQLVLADMVKIATSDITDVVEIDPLTGMSSIKPLDTISNGMTRIIKKVKENRVIRESKDDKGDMILYDKVEYELWDKQKAQETILRMAGKLSDKVDLNLKEPIEVKIVREISSEGKCD